MLAALIEDISAITNCECVTALDANLAEQHPLAGCTIPVEDSREADAVFLALATLSDAVLVIAPETENILLAYRERVSELDNRFVGCSSQAIELCADKKLLADHLLSHDIPTIPIVGSGCDQFSQLNFPCIIKPRDGAGSQLTFLIENEADWKAALRQFEQCGNNLVPICQPYVEGQMVSVAALVECDQNILEIFPVAAQSFSKDKRFRYQGGKVPSAVSCIEQIESIVRKTCSTMTGLNGYVGYDFVIPDGQPDEPLLLEINPRLTTSYVGYRKLTDENLAERMLFPNRYSEPIHWNDDVVAFDLFGEEERQS